MHVGGIINLLLIVLISPIFIAAQSQPLNSSRDPIQKDSCRICEFPNFFKFKDVPKPDRVLDLKLKNESIIFNCLSVRRVIIDVEGNNEQGVQIKYLLDGACHDTTFLISDVSDLRLGNIGSAGQPFLLPIKPARYFVCQQGTLGVSESFLEITGNLGYGGSYSNNLNRNVGFSSIYYGLEALINPLGGILGKQTTVALGGGCFLEGGRLRLPIQVQLRWRFLGDQHISESFDFIPNACQFASPGEKPISPNDQEEFSESSCKEITKGYSAIDSTVYYLKQKKIITDSFRPYLFLEGGVIYDGFTEGAGKAPAINPEDYGQYLAGGGIGLPFGDFFSISLSYRFIRLNLRTVCQSCTNFYVLNTNEIHSILLKAGIRINW